VDDNRLRRFKKGALTIVAVIVTAVFLYWIGSALLPRWWAHRIGDQVHGSIAAGIIVGLFYGFVFTGLPLFVGWIGFHRRRPWRWWVAFGVGAILLATPNLLTLGIVLGHGNASHAGERTLDVDAPAYRTSVLVGAILAALVTAALVYLVLSRKHFRGRVGKLLERLKIAEAEPAPPALADAAPAPPVPAEPGPAPPPDQAPPP
jgi:hypothetical protein